MRARLTELVVFAGVGFFTFLTACLVVGTALGDTPDSKSTSDHWVLSLPKEQQNKQVSITVFVSNEAGKAAADATVFGCCQLWDFMTRVEADDAGRAVLQGPIGDWSVFVVVPGPQGWLTARQQVTAAGDREIKLQASQLVEEETLAWLQKNFRSLTPAERASVRDALKQEQQKFRRDGNLDEAVFAAERLLAIQRESLGETNAATAEILVWLGELHQRQDDFLAGHRVLDKALAIQIALQGQNHWRVTDVRRALKELERAASLSAEERQRLLEADQQIEEAGEVLAAAAPRLLTREEQLKKLEELREKPEAGLLSNQIEDLEKLRQRARQQALTLMNKALPVYKELLGDEHRRYLGLLDGLAHLHASTGSGDRAGALRHEVLRIRERILGENHPLYIASVRTLAIHYDQLDEPERAESYFRKALALSRQVHGADDNATVEAMCRLSDFCAKSGRPAEALALLREAYAIQKKSHGERDPTAGALRQRIVQMVLTPAMVALSEAKELRDRGEAKKATARLEQALDDLRQLEYSRDLESWRLEQLAAMVNAAGDEQEAERLSRAADDLRKRQAAVSPPAWKPQTRPQPQRRESPLLQSELRQRIAFSDAFQNDTRPQYETLGEVVWRKGQLTLGAGAWIGKWMKAGRSVEATADLQWPAVSEEQHRQEFQIVFLVPSSDADPTVVFTQTWEQGKIRSEVHIAHTVWRAAADGGSPDQPETTFVRTFPVEGGLAHSWRIAYHYGVLRVSDGTKTVAVGSVDKLGGDVDCVLLASAGNIACRQLNLGADRRSDIYGHGHRELMEMLRELAQAQDLQRAGRTAEAIPSAKRALALAQARFGERHLECAVYLELLAGLHSDLDQYEQAHALYARATNATKSIVGEDHPLYAMRLHNLAMCHTDSGRFSEAESLFKRSLEIKRKWLGQEHPRYAATLAGLASLHHRLGKYEEAMKEHRQALRIEKAALGPLHPEHARSLNNLATVYCDLGEYAEAEQLCRQARDIWKIRLGPLHPDYAIALSNLAAICSARENYYEAENLYQQAGYIQKTWLGEWNAHYAATLNSLAALYREMGEYAKAEPLLYQALDIRRAVLPEYHLDYAGSLRSLANYYSALKRYDLVAPFLSEAHLIVKKQCGEDHPDFAASLNDLALVYWRLGEHAEAERLLLSGREILQKTVGQQHREYAETLDMLAAAQERKRDYPQAEKLWRQALDISRKVYGDDHGNTARSLSNLAILHLTTGSHAEAAKLLRQALDIEIRTVNRTLPWLSESQAMRFINEPYQRIGCDGLLSALRHLPAKDREACVAVWQMRARVTRAITDRRALLGGSDEARALYSRLVATQRQLAQLTRSTAGPEYRDRRERKLVELNAEKERLERQLAVLSNEFRRHVQIRKATLDDLAEVLPLDAAVVQIVQVSVFSPQAVGPETLTSRREYEAFVLRKSDSGASGTVKWIHLGPVGPIDDALTRWRRAVNAKGGRGPHKKQAASDNPDDPASAMPPWQFLRSAVWDKLEPYLDGCSTVIVMPDGDLAFLPWAALPGRQEGTFLIEDYAVATASNGHQLHALVTAAPPDKKQMLLVGGVAYNERRDDTVPTSLQALFDKRPHTGAVHRATGQQKPWGHLAGTAREIERIVGLRPSTSDVVILDGARADETAVGRQMHGCRYIHLATHGFFAQANYRSFFLAGKTGPAAERLEDSIGGADRIMLRNPLILSGVVLAGANLPPQTDWLGLPTGEDGVLTGEEVANLDLRGTDLVVLSACETGLGIVGGGEGVLGLQRAFHLAGARTVIASSWNVDDVATQTLMVELYRNLWEKKMTKLEALRQAQLTMLRRYDPRASQLRPRGLVSLDPEQRAEGSRSLPPYYWAGFVLSGDWR